MNQQLTPLADALLSDVGEAAVPFDVPGHKGRLHALSAYFGEKCLALDKNSRPSLDYLCQPRGVIKEAQQLAAEAFGAKHAYFMVGGTTSSVQAMIMSACAPNDKILLPRNVHYSIIYAIILSGAIPIYIDPCVQDKIGISLGMSLESIKACIEQNPDAKAILVNNPTYYGICSDIKSIVALAHKHNMLVLADEAHGTHFYFGDGLPAAAMRNGADMAAVSMHKTGGSLTQSSILLVGDKPNAEHVMNIINLTRTTSASYLLMASLDIARSYLATEGRQVLSKALSMADNAREKINQINGYYAFGSEIIDGNAVFDFDRGKLSVHTLGTGLAGIEVYSILRKKYGIQLEFGDTANILALSTIADRQADYDKLVCALAEIKDKHGQTKAPRFSYEYIHPTPCISPRNAFYAPKKRLPITECAGCISGEAIMCYPPGIPILIPGELITKDIIEHIVYAVEKGCSVIGLLDDGSIEVVNS